MDANASDNKGCIDLRVSNPTAVGLTYPNAELRQALGHPGLIKYTPDPQGLGSARECIAGDWQTRGQLVDADDIVLTASTSEAYALLFKLLCDPGDEVLVPEPSYPLFEVLTRLEGVEARSYRLAYDGAWHIDFDSLAQNQSSRTRAIVVVSPNNPTGNFVKRGEFEELGRLGLPLIADEVFWPYRLLPATEASPSAVEQRDSLVFTLDGLSKRAGLPQLKLAWITVSGPALLKAEAKKRLELINDSYLSASTPVQLGLPRLFELEGGIRRQIIERCSQNLGTLQALLSASAANLLHLEGGWTACLRLPNLDSDDSWTLSLFRERRVLVQPGWLYDLGPEPHWVLGLLAEPNAFERAARAIVDHVQATLGR